jgi:hypothetical protein
MSKIKSKEELAQEIRWLRAKQERDLRRIDELTEQVKGYEELIGINNALVALVLHVNGEITVPRDAVMKAVEELEVLVQLDLEKNCYIMKAVKKE